MGVLVRILAAAAITLSPLPLIAQERPGQPASPPRTAPAAPAAPAAGSPSPSASEAPSPSAGEEIYLQLNNLQPIDPGGCRLTFVATNGREEPIESLGVEVVVFDDEGRVDQFLVLEFSRLMSEKTKAAQFDLASRSCNQISQVLVNDILNCGPIPEGGRTCTELARLDNLTDIELGF